MPIYTSSGVGGGSSRATVDDLVDRVYRDYLHASDDQPVIVTVDGAVTDLATSIVVDLDALSPDEQFLLAPGVLAEIGNEQVRITAVDEPTATLTVIRGVNGTEATAITEGSEIRVAPMYPRQTVFDAVADNIVALYPDLSHKATATVTSASSPVEVSADIVSVVSARRLSSGAVRHVNVELERNWQPASTTRTALAFYGIASGTDVYVTYEARFARPTSEADVVGDLGVDAAWERIVVVGAAAQVMAGRSLDAASAEYIVEQMEREAFPYRAGMDLRDGLLRYHAFLLQQARKSLRSDRTVPVVMHR